MWAYAGWGAVNAALGYLLTFPLLLLVLLGRFARARVWHDVVAPFHGAEASGAAVGVLVAGVPLGLLAAWANRRLRRRPRLGAWPPAVYWPLTAAVLAAPSAVAYVAEPTVPQLLGKGLFW